MAVLLLFFAGGGLALRGAEPFKPLEISGQNFRLIPESERTLQRLIIGLEPNSTKAYIIPGVASASAANKERVRQLRRELYMIHFELLHGNLMHVLPSHTRLFVATPDPEYVVESRGNEPEIFANYLKLRAGWTDAQIKKRVSYFKVPESLPFPQDMAEILGRDKSERLVLGLGEDVPAVYGQAADALAQNFPQDFKIYRIPKLDTEGGDTEVVWQADGSIGVLVGQNRIRRYLEVQKSMDLRGRMSPQDWIADALAAFQKGFFGVPVIILGRQELENPEYISPEVFHIDMMANVLRNGSRVMAFIPSFEQNPFDATTAQPLGPTIIRRAQHYYDEAAQDLKQKGYEIVRLPFRDHPVRNPVNVGKFVNPATGKSTIFLSKYPYHYSLGGEKPSMQAEVQQVLDAMEDAISLWKGSPSDEHWNALQKALSAVWEKFKQAETSPNPLFDAQATIYRAHGIEVVPVVLYPSSEGGIHCLLLK